MTTEEHPHLTQSNPHIGWIDYAKAFAIYSVVLLHTHSVEDISVAINGYVMPLFFFLSGFLFSRKRNPSFPKFFRKRFRQLLIPYLWINVVAYILWLTVLRYYGNDAESPLEWHEPILGILLGIPPLLVHDIPLWSILCFFVVEIIYYILPHQEKWWDIVIAAAAYTIASVISGFAGREGVAIPLTLGPAMAAIAFYACGHFVRSISGKLKFLFTPSVWVTAVGLILLFTGLFFNAPTAFFLGILGNPIAFFTSASGGIIFAIQLSLWLDAFLHDKALVKLISRGTLLICGFHILFFAVIKGAMLFGFGIQPEELTSNFIRGFIFSLVAMALCLPVIWIIEKYFRFLVSK